MSKKQTHQKIYMTISNPGKLQPGASPRYNFDRSGGTIGSQGANWLLIDPQQRVSAIHSEIIWADGAFCVVDRSGDTRINGHNAGIGAGHTAMLNDGDTLQIGPYKITIYFSEMSHGSLDSGKALGEYELGEIVRDNARQLTDNRAEDEELPDITSELENHPGQEEFDHMSTNKKNANKNLNDPLAALDADTTVKKEKEDKSLIGTTHYGKSPNPSAQADLTSTSREAVSSYRTSQASGDEAYASPPRSSLHEWEEAYSQIDSNTQHLAAMPLQQGMETHLGSMDSTAAHHLLVEVGKSLKVTIEGIKKLYDAQGQDDKNQLSMLTRTLQPIEDNPLRLKQSYEETVRAMFSDHKSAVHLSAPAAIEESLEQARMHNIAVIQAISSSLDALLKAFSPHVLSQRFERYRSQEEHQNPSLSGGEWEWQMYNHYYNELASKRQHGFEKLFWEIFEQAYDRSMRELAS